MMKRVTAVVSTLIFAGLASVALNAQTTPQPALTAAEAKRTAAPAVVSPGVVVFKDPVTGQIRQPDASEIGDLANSAPSASAVTSAAMPAVSQAMTGAGGHPGMRLGQDSMMYMVLSKTADGKLVEECVTGDKAATAKVAAAAKTTGIVVEKEVPHVQ